jgi:hypothetical protein
LRFLSLPNSRSRERETEREGGGKSEGGRKRGSMAFWFTLSAASSLTLSAATHLKPRQNF